MVLLTLPATVGAKRTEIERLAPGSSTTGASAVPMMFSPVTAGFPKMPLATKNR